MQPTVHLMLLLALRAPPPRLICTRAGGRLCSTRRAGAGMQMAAERDDQLALIADGAKEAPLPGHTSFFSDLEMDEDALRKRFKKLAAELHPDRLGSDAPEEAVARFQELSEEYARLLEECRSEKQRTLLQNAWMSVGGLAALASLAFENPALTALIVSTLATWVSSDDTDESAVLRRISALAEKSAGDALLILEAGAQAMRSSAERLTLPASGEAAVEAVEREALAAASEAAQAELLAATHAERVQVARDAADEAAAVSMRAADENLAAVYAATVAVEKNATAWRAASASLNAKPPKASWKVERQAKLRERLLSEAAGAAQRADELCRTRDEVTRVATDAADEAEALQLDADAAQAAAMEAQRMAGLAKRAAAEAQERVTLAATEAATKAAAWEQTESDAKKVAEAASDAGGALGGALGAAAAAFVTAGQEVIAEAAAREETVRRERLDSLRAEGEEVVAKRVAAAEAEAEARLRLKNLREDAASEAEHAQESQLTSEEEAAVDVMVAATMARQADILTDEETMQGQHSIRSDPPQPDQRS